MKDLPCLCNGTHGLNRHVDGDEIHTSCWVPESLKKSIFESINQVCRNRPDDASNFFGLVFWVVMMDRPEEWYFKRCSTKKGSIHGITYFRTKK